MTVSYTADVANASQFGCFTKILRRWKGSVYKLVYKELIAYIAVYFALNITYRTVLCQEGMESYRRMFESIKAYCSIQMSSIPMTFGLGFYVSLIVKRWWDQYMTLPWPDSMAMFIAGIVNGLDERGRMMRRNIMRYVMLSYVITLRRISFRVRKRFPTMDHVIEAGLMRSDELKCMQMLDEKCSVSKWWMPLIWATNILVQARAEDRIKSDPAYVGILTQLSTIRQGLTSVQHYDTISVPLVYTQVVTLSIYSYFLAALMGAQWVTPEDPDDFEVTYKLPSFSNVIANNNTGFFFGDQTINSQAKAGNGAQGYQGLDLYFPFFLTLQFTFYVGWLKVAETLINPFGEDDDDFELNYLIDRHIQVGYMIVDDMHHNHPEMLKDMYWNVSVPTNLPYTEETQHYRKVEPKGSAEQREEEDSNSMAYYSVLKSKLGGSNRALEAAEVLSSDYEAVDASLFGKFKAKLRKSQIRKSERSSRRSKASTIDDSDKYEDHRSKSIYSKFWHSRLMMPSGRQRRTTVSCMPPEVAEKNDFYKSYNSKETSSTHIPSPNLGLSQRNHSHLSTIAENQNSPYSTHVGSRRNSEHPSTDGLFESVQANKLIDHFRRNNAESSSLSSGIFFEVDDTRKGSLRSDVLGDTNSSCYYPLGSEHNVPSRFVVEEVNANNYEPIHFGAHRGSSKAHGPSPQVPKRLARMALTALQLNTLAENEGELVEEEEDKQSLPNRIHVDDKQRLIMESKKSHEGARKTTVPHPETNSAFDDNSPFYV